MSKYEEWEMRKVGFDSQLNIVIGERTPAQADESDQGRPADPNENLINLAVFLSEFTTDLFGFFLNGFSDYLGKPGTGGTKLVASAEYPPEFVLQKILRQASFDLTVIQRAIEQRNNDKLRPLLDQFDLLALSALAIAFPDPQKKEAWLIEPAKPFVYFQRDTSVRIIPYANALLIGVPYSALCQPIDLLAIPHEVGHHVYQTGRFLKKEPINLFFEKYFAGQDDWIQNWLEEIFADLYGFLVAGPIVAFSLQEILIDNLPGSLAEDDGEHPVGISRPLGFSKLFESKSALTAKETVEKLTSIWDERTKEIGLAKTFKPKTQDEVVKRDDAGKILSVVMHDMNTEINVRTGDALDFPTAISTSTKLKPWTLFPKGTSSTKKAAGNHLDPEAPFSRFGIASVLDAQKDQINKLKQIYEEQDFRLSRKAQNEFWLTGQINYWSQRANLPPLVPDIWKLIFTAFSWADKPDDTRPVKGPETIHY